MNGGTKNQGVRRRQDRDKDVVANSGMRKIQEMDRKMCLDFGMQENITHRDSSSCEIHAGFGVCRMA